MHLPFTFATGEAMLYQTGYPLHGFPDSAPGKAKGSKSKKSRQDKSSSDGLDPKSLLGALMSQDESVYVCQPDPEPKPSYHAVLGEGGGAYAGLTGNSWGGGPERRGVPASSFDPLLATLDSLSLEGEEACSNSELFSALENLGLNAEDLELLLLDERMIQVELDSNHVPSLSDLLTNGEILSYIHDSLEGAEPPAGHAPSSSSSAPLTQLSQQMQQHVGKAAQTQPADANGSIPATAAWMTSSPHQHRAPLNGDAHQQLQWAEPQPPLGYVPNGHTFSHYSVPPPAGGAALNGASDGCQYGGVVDAAQQPYQPVQVPVPVQVPPAQNASVSLEQLLGLSHNLPLDAYGVFNGAADAAHAKVRGASGH